MSTWKSDAEIRRNRTPAMAPPPRSRLRFVLPVYLVAVIVAIGVLIV